MSYEEFMKVEDWEAREEELSRKYDQRYTDNDKLYSETVNKPLVSQPCVHPWSGGNRNSGRRFDRNNRGRYDGNNRGRYDGNNRERYDGNRNSYHSRNSYDSHRDRDRDYNRSRNFNSRY